MFVIHLYIIPLVYLEFYTCVQTVSSPQAHADGADFQVTSRSGGSAMRYLPVLLAMFSMDFMNGLFTAQSDEHTTMLRNEEILRVTISC